MENQFGGFVCMGRYEEIDAGGKGSEGGGVVSRACDEDTVDVIDDDFLCVGGGDREDEGSGWGRSFFAKFGFGLCVVVGVKGGDSEGKRRRIRIRRHRQ
jgi:hypothetical protein